MENNIITTPIQTIDGVNIYVKDFENYIAETYYLLYQNSLFLKNEINYYLSKQNGSREAETKSIITAFIENYNDVNNICSLLQPYVKIPYLLKIKSKVKNPTTNILKDYFYLKRDWTSSSESENQIQETVNLIKTHLTNDYKNSLFIGCGTGRYFVELIDSFEVNIAVDKSFSMIWHLSQLQKGDVGFYIPTLKNVIDIFEGNKKHIASIPNDLLNSITKKGQFFVADALDLPLRGSSIDVVFSIYFTDVIALDLLLPSIKRILIKNGLFVHFGPLDYFFSDINYMYTPREIEQIFIEQGFEILENSFFTTLHLPDSNVLTNLQIKNWLFVAKYKDIY